MSNIIRLSSKILRALPHHCQQIVSVTGHGGGADINSFAKIGRSLQTTNILESVNSRRRIVCGRVDHWQNSKQKQLWLAAALVHIEPRLRRLVGYCHLPALQAAIMKELKLGGAEERSRQTA